MSSKVCFRCTHWEWQNSACKDIVILRRVNIHKQVVCFLHLQSKPCQSLLPQLLGKDITKC